MKLIRLKITDPKGFRSLQAGFEHHFRTAWNLDAEEEFAPFVCAGPNGSGKSNLLEVLAAIFFQLEVLRVRRSFLPDTFLHDEEANPNGVKDGDGSPNGYELEYQIAVPDRYCSSASPRFADVKVIKLINESPELFWLNQSEFEVNEVGVISDDERGILLPEYILGYSSGENEILSLPFFKMRFIQYDEYWDALQRQLPYFGKPETRLTYLDGAFSQAILLCNLLFHSSETLSPLIEDTGIEELQEFRIIIRRTVAIDRSQIKQFGNRDDKEEEKDEDILKNHPALEPITVEQNDWRYRANITKLLEGSDSSSHSSIISRLKRCATSYFEDEATDTLYLDYYVNQATKDAFNANFRESPVVLFQALQVLLTLNHYSVSETLKQELYTSGSLYVSETIPTLASDERIMRFKDFCLKKTGVERPVLLKSLSDGEHQLLHSLGLCLLFKNTNSLFLLDEPETHFNPDWRSNFISRLHQCFDGSDGSREMFVTTHTPFLISDSKPEKVLVFKKENGEVEIEPPGYNTLGASINKITISTFDKSETIGERAHTKIKEFREDFKKGKDKEQLIADINSQLGDSVEKLLLLKSIRNSMEQKN